MVLVVWFDTGALGLLIGNFTGTAIVYAILIVARRETVGFRRFETPVLRELLVFSLPLMPADIALWALNLADRLQVQQLGQPSALGSYRPPPGCRWRGDGHGRVPDRLAAVRPPGARTGDAKAKLTYARCATYWSVVMGWGLAGISLLAAALHPRRRSRRRRHDAIPVVPMLVTGIVLYGWYLIVNIGVTVAKKTRMTPVISAIAAVV